MRTLYLDCSMGAAGDMLTAALLELCSDKEGFIEKMNTLLAGRAVMTAIPDIKCGVLGTHVKVSINGESECEAMHHTHHGHEDGNCHAHHQHVAERDSHEHKHHHHVGITEILELIEQMDIPEKVRQDVANVYRIIARAEAKVHGREMEQVHFHELGSIDALADVLSVCMLMEILAPDRVLASAVNVGGGTVRCAHGILPVPAPATELILRDVPCYCGNVKSELCTPTGAALLKYFVKDFVPMPVMRVSAAGYGTGSKDFKQLNALRAMLGESMDV